MSVALSNVQLPTLAVSIEDTEWCDNHGVCLFLSRHVVHGTEYTLEPCAATADISGYPDMSTMIQVHHLHLRLAMHHTTALESVANPGCLSNPELLEAMDRTWSLDLTVLTCFELRVNSSDMSDGISWH
jgi:hypothetical protein